MEISENIKSRPELKSYFVKNAIPTESHFADFVDSTLNQREDGLVKVAGSPLSVEAAGDATGLKRAVNLYWDFAEDGARWALNLNPRSAPADPTTARPGFSISDADNNSRLFIDPANGNVGLSKVNPQAPLDIRGGNWNPSNTEGDFRIGNDTVRFKIGIATGGGGTGDVRMRAHGGTDRLMLGSGTTDVLTIRNNRVGVLTLTPQDTLDVHGAMRFNGNAQRRIHGDTRAARHAVVIGGHWDELEVKGRVIDWTGSNLHIGYQNDHPDHFIEMGRRVGNLRFFTGSSEAMRITGGNVGIGTSSPSAKLHVVGDLLGAAQGASNAAYKIYSGRTSVTATPWAQYNNNPSSNGVYVNINTSAAGFTQTPMYFTSLGGNSSHWTTTGATSIYNAARNSFRVYVHQPGITPAIARTRRYHINWVAIGR